MWQIELVGESVLLQKRGRDGDTTEERQGKRQAQLACHPVRLLGVFVM